MTHSKLTVFIPDERNVTDNEFAAAMADLRMHFRGEVHYTLQQVEVPVHDEPAEDPV